MTGTAAEVLRARAEALAARERIDETLTRLRHRLDPRVKAQETWDDLRDHGREMGDDALEYAYEQPRNVAIGVSALALFLIRRPLWRLACRVFRRKTPDPLPKPMLKKNPTGRLVSLSGKGGEIR